MESMLKFHFISIDIIKNGMHYLFTLMKYSKLRTILNKEKVVRLLVLKIKLFKKIHYD